MMDFPFHIQYTKPHLLTDIYGTCFIIIIQNMIIKIVLLLQLNEKYQLRNAYQNSEIKALHREDENK
jgi:hypothetical protein